MDFCGLSHPSQGGVLQLALDLLGLLPVLAGAPGPILPLHVQVHLQRGRLDVLSNVDDLGQAGHAQRHILGRHTGKVEGVEGHLGGGLPNGLGSNCADHFSWICLRLQQALWSCQSVLWNEEGSAAQVETDHCQASQANYRQNTWCQEPCLPLLMCCSRYVTTPRQSRMLLMTDNT